ncbi:uncharacterized protein FIBRA_02082 [Fibroporia radiculosa]|uniref:Uncharacterized protein n=1 Tax=Fibroporia radiculosa TaxID=599839 RepID=J4GMB9_9APHY|nr:uncharacterized protein FIBRA_02082 [Fibroporia radiculosa]CCM00055.1 predicted protein [Fibroporia radiculosa]
MAATATASSLIAPRSGLQYYNVLDAVLALPHTLRTSFLSSPILISPLILVAPVILILLRVAFVQARKLIASRKDRHSMSYVVKWGRERLHFTLPPPDTKLAAIRHQLAEYTQLPPQSFKLIHAGAVMKDDNAPISAYGIKPGSTIALVGGGEDLEPSGRASSKHKEKPQERTEASIVAQIRGELDSVRRTLQPDVDGFLTTLNPDYVPPSVSSAAPPAAAGRRNPDLAREHIRLGELLLQSLLRLDAITAEGEWEEARRERKGAVREVQALLDRLDGGWRKRPQTKI